MTAWFCLRVQLRQERKVAAQLTENGVLAYVPVEICKIEVKHRTSQGVILRKVPRTRALIPNYVFAVLPDDDAIDLARSIRPVREVMSNAHGKPKAVDLTKLRGLFLAEMFRCFDGMYEAPKRKGHTHRWKKGDRVRVQTGPFEDWIGTVIGTKGRQKVEVMFSMFGREPEIEIGEDDLTQALDVALRTAA